MRGERLLCIVFIFTQGVGWDRPHIPHILVDLDFIRWMVGLKYVHFGLVNQFGVRLVGEGGQIFICILIFQIWVDYERSWERPHILHIVVSVRSSMFFVYGINHLVVRL